MIIAKYISVLWSFELKENVVVINLKQLGSIQKILTGIKRK